MAGAAAGDVLREAERLYRSGQVAAALDLCEAALAGQPDDVRLLALSGALAGERGDAPLAARRLAAADRLRPGQTAILFNLGVALQRGGDAAAAAAAFARAVAGRPDHVEAWFGLAQARQQSGDGDGALAAYRQVTALDPGHPGARHMAAALAGDNPAAAPAGYARTLFDDYAPRFDTELVGRLGYRVPAELRAAVLAAAPGRRFARALDLGCGTGLAGAALAGLTAALHGVDASPAMLEQAAARGVYTTLQAGDLTERLLQAAAAGEGFDLIVAADVLVYLGALETVFAAVAGCLAGDGLFAFSVERPDPAAGGYRLRPSGRYAHAEDYVATLAAAAGLAIVHRRETALRQDAGQPVAGSVYVLARPPAGR